MKKHLHLFPDIRSKGERENRLPCQCILQSGGFRYRCRWDWARFPEELEGCTVAGVACDSRNNVYAAVRAPGCPGVAKFSPEGAFLGYYAKNLDLGRAHGIFLDREDCLWLTDDTFHVVCRLDQSDRLLKTLGVFRQGSDTGVDASIDSHLRYLTIRRTAGPFNMPTGVAQGPDGDIYVSDGYGNAAVHRFSPEGALLRTWGAPGNAPGEFNIPTASAPTPKAGSGWRTGITTGSRFSIPTAGCSTSSPDFCIPPGFGAAGSISTSPSWTAAFPFMTWNSGGKPSWAMPPPSIRPTASAATGTGTCTWDNLHPTSWQSWSVSTEFEWRKSSCP